MLDFILAHLAADEEGQTMAEYAVVLAVITAGIIGVLLLLSGGIEDTLNRIVGAL